MEKYDLWDGPKFNLIRQLDKKVNFFTIPGSGFDLNCCQRGFWNVATLWSTIWSRCIYLLPFLASRLVICTFFEFFNILAFVFTLELGSDKIRYWHLSSSLRSYSHFCSCLSYTIHLRKLRNWVSVLNLKLLANFFNHLPIQILRIIGNRFSWQAIAVNDILFHIPSYYSLGNAFVGSGFHPFGKIVDSH